MNLALQSHPWELPLHSLAHEARRAGTGPVPRPLADRDSLRRAYEACEAITARHSRSFTLASGLLPPDKRRAVRALYAFCRVSDNLVDRPQGDARAALAAWRARALAAQPPAGDPVTAAWADTRRRYRIPLRYAEQLLEGVGRDLRPVKYHTFPELAGYAYAVASTVGLMSMHIIGFSGPEAIPYAIRLGVALQLTNVLRDVGEDLRSGRLYLPLEELAAFGLQEEDLRQEKDLLAGRVDERWRAFMRFQIQRNRRLYERAWPGIALLDRDGRFAIAAAADLYRAILDDIEAHDYDVFTRRARVSAWGKLRRLPALWLSQTLWA